MKKYLVANAWSGWRLGLVWILCVAAVLLLGALRTATDAELAFASLALLPVLFISWFGGRRSGFAMAFIAAAMWAASDITAEREFSAAWIPWGNALIRWINYSLVVWLLSLVRIQLITEHKHATRDILTGLLNRRAFLEVGVDEVERARRYKHPMAAMFLDLDNFKCLNDTLGHDAGDYALQAAAQAMQSALRRNDRVARLGGDEFAMLLPEIGYDAAVDVGRKVFAAVNEKLRLFPPVSASVGIAWFENADREFSTMLKSADDLMYEVKNSGKSDLRSRRFSAMEIFIVVD